MGRPATVTGSFLDKLPRIVGAAGLFAAGLIVAYLVFGGSAADTAGRRRAGPLAGLRAVATSRDGTLWVGGHFGVRRLDENLGPVFGWPTDEPVVALSIEASGHVWAATRKTVTRYTPGGEKAGGAGKLGCPDELFDFLSGIAVSGDDVFIADSGGRVVYRHDTDGLFVNNIGREKDGEEEARLLAPSPCIDCVAADGVVWVTNPGRHRVERYDFEGELLGHWGRQGNGETDFPGCCNPVGLAMLPAGRLAVAQKGQPCVKVFDAERGALLQVLGLGEFERGSGGPSIAAHGGKIYAVDSGAGCIRVFQARPPAKEE